MDTNSDNIDIEDAPISFKSLVWHHFGFPVEKKNGEGVADKTRTICKLCKTILPYTLSNTSNMQSHLQRHHREIKLAPAIANRASLAKGQTTLTTRFAPQLPPSSPRAMTITRDIGYMIAYGMRPFSIVEDPSVRRLLRRMDPKYTVPSRTHFSTKVVPKIYEETKATVKQTLQETESIAITTDGWTSRSTKSYITITAHGINNDWKMENVVLQTRPIYESHTGRSNAILLVNADYSCFVRIVL